MSVFRTYGGQFVSLVNPEPSTIDIRDIACALSRIVRFSGATRLPINVADHSLNVVRLLSLRKATPATQMLGLLHDAHETYLGDITGPVRYAISEFVGQDLIGRMAQRLDTAIRRAFNLEAHANFSSLSQVKIADVMILAAEWRDYMSGPCPTASDAAPFAIRPRNPDKAEEDFLKTFERLRLEMGPAPEVVTP